MPVQDDEAGLETASVLNSDSALALSSLIQQEASGGPPGSRGGLTGSVEAAALTSQNRQVNFIIFFREILLKITITKCQ